jgi:hypothetical protein
VHAHVQGLVAIVKMATMLEEYSTEEQRSVVPFLWVKGLSGKGYSYVYVSCLRWEVFIADREIQGRSKVADFARPAAEVTETIVKKTSMLRYSCTAKATGQVF